MIRRAVKLVLFASALGAGGLLAVAVARDTVTGSGVSVTEERDIGEVTSVVLAGSGELTIVPGSPASLSVTADDNILPVIETETEGGKLTLHTRSRTDVRPKTKIAYTLTVPRLTAITVSGAGHVKADQLTAGALTVKLSGAGTAKLNNVACKSLALHLSGAGTATVTGVAEKLTVKLSGAGDIDAVGLKASSADVQVSGAGDIRVWATDELKARISGAGGVKYKGSPKVEQKVSGAGRIRPIEEDAK
jgi:hypothetical protein